MFRVKYWNSRVTEAIHTRVRQKALISSDSLYCFVSCLFTFLPSKIYSRFVILHSATIVRALRLF
jgi:hypothetical protein